MKSNRFLESQRKELFPSDRFEESFRRGTKVSSSAAHRISEWERTLSNRSKNGVVDTNRLPSVIEHSPTCLDNGRSSRNIAKKPADQFPRNIIPPVLQTFTAKKFCFSEIWQTSFFFFIKDALLERNWISNLIKSQLPIYNLQSMELLCTAKKNGILGGDFSTKKMKYSRKRSSRSLFHSQKENYFYSSKSSALAARQMILNFSQYFFRYENTNNTLPPGCFVNYAERNGLFDLTDQRTREILESPTIVEREEN